YSTYRVFDIVHRNNDRWMLGRPILLFRKEAAVNRSGSLDAGRVGFGCGYRDVIAHVLTKHLGLPTERRLIELRHPLAILIRHFKVNDRIHGSISNKVKCSCLKKTALVGVWVQIQCHAIRCRRQRKLYRTRSGIIFGPNPRATNFASHTFLDVAKTDRMLLRPEIALAGHERPPDVPECPKSVPKCPRKRVFCGNLGGDHEVESAKLGISQEICAANGWR